MEVEINYQGEKLRVVGAYIEPTGIWASDFILEEVWWTDENYDEFEILNNKSPRYIIPELSPIDDLDISVIVQYACDKVEAQ